MINGDETVTVVGCHSPKSNVPKRQVISFFRHPLPSSCKRMVDERVSSLAKPSSFQSTWDSFGKSSTQKCAKQ